MFATYKQVSNVNSLCHSDTADEEGTKLAPETRQMFYDANTKRDL